MVPKVSVIIPTKNRANYISSAIQSALNQTFQDFEIIVVDGGSTDNTREVVSRFNDERIRYIQENRDKGISAARNIGIRLSIGKFIAFLDDDDVWLPRKLEKQLRIFDQNYNIGVVYSGVYIIDKSGDVIGSKFPYLRGNIFPRILEKNYVGNCSTIIVRKECLERVGLFDETLYGCEDFDLLIRLAKYYQFDYVKEPLVLYRVHEKNISKKHHQILRAKKLLRNKYSKELLTATNRRRITAFWHYSLGVQYCKCGNIQQGIKQFIKAVGAGHFFVVYYCLSRFIVGFKSIKYEFRNL